MKSVRGAVQQLVTGVGGRVLRGPLVKAREMGPNRCPAEVDHAAVIIEVAAAAVDDEAEPCAGAVAADRGARSRTDGRINACAARFLQVRCAGCCTGNRGLKRLAAGRQIGGAAMSGITPKAGYDAAPRYVKRWARFGLMRCSKQPLGSTSEPTT
jgi:hypothetical protein